MATSLALDFDARTGCREREENAAAVPASLGAVLGIGVTLSAEPGQTIVVEDDPIDHAYRIVSGTVRLYQSIADGRRQVIDFLGAGDCFGLMGQACHAHSVEAITRVTMVRYPRRAVEAAIQANPDLARRMFQLACVELERAQRQMLLLGRKTADERLASFLLRLADDERSVTLAMSRLDIADHLGLTIETVSRTLSRFKRDGLIDFRNRQQITLLATARLQALADGESAHAH